MNDTPRARIIERDDEGNEILNIDITVALTTEGLSTWVHRFNNEDGEYNAVLEGMDIILTRRNPYTPLRPLREVKAALAKEGK